MRTKDIFHILYFFIICFFFFVLRIGQTGRPLRVGQEGSDQDHQPRKIVGVRVDES